MPTKQQPESPCLRRQAGTAMVSHQTVSHRLLKLLQIYLSLIAVFATGLTTAAPMQTDKAPDGNAAAVVMGVHHFPPDFIVSKDGQTCGGAGVDMARTILARAGLTLETRCVLPARLYVLLEKGDIDLTINIKSTAALASQPPPVFVDPPYMALQLVLYSHKKTSAAPNDDSVSAIRAFDYQGQRKQLVARGYRFNDAADAGQAIDMFLHQRTEHLLTYEGPFRAYIQQHDPTVLNRLDRRAIENIPAFFVVSAKSAQQSQIVQAINSYAAALHCRYLRSCTAP